MKIESVSATLWVNGCCEALTSFYSVILRRESIWVPNNLSYFEISLICELDTTCICAPIFTAVLVSAIAYTLVITTNICVFVEGKADPEKKAVRETDTERERR